MPLAQLMLRPQYRSDGTIIARDFYQRCLPLSCRLDRAVGFFSSGVFSACPSAFHNFFENGGVIRVVTSPVLSRSDINAIARGYRDKPQLAGQDALAKLLMSSHEVKQNLPELVAWLVASNRLEVKVALCTNHNRASLYHEKVGIFSDSEHNKVAFSGSANESAAALLTNFESIDVFRSWEPSERIRAEQKTAAFERLWQDDTPNLEVISFPRAATLGALRVRDLPSVPSKEGHDPAEASLSEMPEAGPIPGIQETLAIPTAISLRKHQSASVRNWFAENGRGILEMATGSGKTIAALAIAAKLYEAVGSPLMVVVVCPYLHLASQWIEEAKPFGLEPLLCAINRQRWQDELSMRLYTLTSGSRRILSVVVTTATFGSEAFQQALARAPTRTLIIADEVHHLGARQTQARLPSNVKYRLGLSATPRRLYDPEGTAAIQQYFGPVIVDYPLSEALSDGVLCPYRYHPVIVTLDDDEFEQYVELTTKIAQALASGQEFDDSPFLLRLSVKRARVLATAKQKIPELVRLLSPLNHTTHNLIYCGDGTVEDPVDSDVLRHVDAVVKAVGRDLGMRVARYVAETALTRRHRLRRWFAAGELQALIAIRCLDEGVDIPETRRAFILASSANPRQFIQRRGRILRRARDKDMAEIYDFIVDPPEFGVTDEGALYNVTRTLFRRELDRVNEFAELAVNGPEAMSKLLPIQSRLNLLHYNGAADHE